MLYQLPNGKVISLSLEEYLSMSDRELHELANSGYGTNPYYNSSFSKGTKKEKAPKENTESDLDYTPDNDEPDTKGPINIHDLPED